MNVTIMPEVGPKIPRPKFSAEVFGPIFPPICFGRVFPPNFSAEFLGRCFRLNFSADVFGQALAREADPELQVRRNAGSPTLQLGAKRGGWLYFIFLGSAISSFDSSQSAVHQQKNFSPSIGPPAAKK